MQKATGVVMAALDMAATAFLVPLEVAIAFLAALDLAQANIIAEVDIETEGIMKAIGVITGDIDIMDAEMLLVI